MSYQYPPQQPQYPPPPAYQPPPAPKKANGCLIGLAVIGIIFLGIVAIVVMAAMTSSGPSTTAETTTVSVGPSGTSTTVVSTPAVKKANPLTDDGMFEVGTEIKPGKYRYTKTKPFASWERCSDTDCKVLEGLITHEYPDGPGFVEIQPTDKYFKKRGLVLTPAR